MLRTLEAVIEPDGRVRLLEPVTLTTAHRALVTVLEESGEAEENITALLSEPALADWNSEEEDAAAPRGTSGQSSHRGLSAEELRSFAGTISAEDLDIMERVIEEEFERVNPHEW